MIGSSRSYAIGMAHFQIAGGVKSLVFVCITYLVLFGAGTSLFYFADTSVRFRSALPGMAMSLLLVIETIVLLLLGSARVSGAIRTDVTSKMIESHRLMPIPTWRAVMGYLLGSTTHALAFAGINAILCCIFSAAAGLSLVQTLLYQGMLLLFALLLWTATALGTLLFRHVFAVALLGLLLGGFGLIFLYLFLPGFALLIGPMMVDSIFAPGVILHSISPWIYPASIGAQLAVIAILFTGACRRYRGTARTTFSHLQALLFILIWCAISIVGMLLWQSFRFRDTPDGDLRYPQIVGSVIAAMIFLLIPARTLTAAPPRKNVLLFSTLFMFACALLVALIPFGAIGPYRYSEFYSEWNNEDWGRMIADPDRFRLALALTAAVVLAHAFLMPLLFRALRRCKPMLTWILLSLFMLTLWIGPLFLELMRNLIQQSDPTAVKANFTVLGTLSPIGMLIIYWTDLERPPSPVVGLIFQCSLPAILGLVLLLRHRRRSALLKVATTDTGSVQKTIAHGDHVQV